MMMQPFDDRPCNLGEGALWQPERQTLYWFDITAKRLLARGPDGPRAWQFSEMHSAAARIDADHLLLASETGLWHFTINDGTRRLLCPLEADNPVTRSNDGRADPQGGFWIGTMGKVAEPGAGSIWRWYKGELRRLFTGLSISNAICFTPNGKFARFTDTVTAQVMQVALDAEGWPVSAPQIWLDLSGEGLNPDGAVIDSEGVFWVAQWGAGRVAAYGSDGKFLRAITLPAPHASCPAFGGDDLTTLFCTSALQGMDNEARVASPHAGQVFSLPGVARGQAEHRVSMAV